MSKQRSTLSKQHSTLLHTNNSNVERFYCKISSFRQRRMLLRHCCRFWQQCCRFRQHVKTNCTCSICFDFVERTKFRSTLLPKTSTLLNVNIVAKNGNNVKATFHIVERIVQLVALDNVASTLLLVWTGLKCYADELYGCACIR